MKTAIAIFCAAVTSAANAQSTQYPPALVRGAAYKKSTWLISACTFNIGKQSITINVNSLTNKTYNVQDADGNNTTFAVTTENVADTVDAIGQKAIYNSDGGQSQIDNAIKNEAGSQAIITTNNAGVVTAVNNAPAQYTSDAMLAFSGIHPIQYNQGEALGLLNTLKLSPNMAKGYKWEDSTIGDGNRTITKYSIAKVTPAATTVNYLKSIFTDSINTNINGIAIIDNATGLIISNNRETISMGYGQVNGVIYIAARRIYTYESCYRSK